MQELKEQLRQAMRRWVTGVAIVTSRYEDITHGMTVNSLTSVSLDPPYIVVTLDNRTRTYQLVKDSGIFGVTILEHNQAALADRFAGRGPEAADRMKDLEVFTLITGAPLLAGGSSFLDSRVVHEFQMPTSTLFVGEVLATSLSEGMDPLVYYNRTYHRLVS